MRAYFFASCLLLASCRGDVTATVAFSANQIPGLFLAQDTVNAKDYTLSLSQARLSFGRVDIITEGDPLEMLQSDLQELFTLELAQEGLDTFISKQFTAENSSLTGAIEFALQNEAQGIFAGSAINFTGEVELTDGTKRAFTVQIQAPAESFQIASLCNQRRLSREISCAPALSFADLFRDIDFDTLAAEVVNDITINPLIDSANVSKAILTIEKNLLIAVLPKLVLRI